MTKLKTVAICQPDAYFLPVLDAIRDQAELVVGDSIETLEPHIPEAEVVMVAWVKNKPVSLRAFWPMFKKLRWVHSLSAGVEHLLFPELIESPVVVTNARGVFKRALAEFATLGALYFSRRVRLMLEQQRQAEWKILEVENIAGRTMGIVGYGEIGRECALLAKGIGMRIAAVRRRHGLAANDAQRDNVIDKAYAPSELKDMLAASDVVVLSAPATPETYHMIGEAELRAMKRTAVLINIGRGTLVDEPQLVRALQEGWIAGAALDVFETEPLPKESPLWAMQNVLVSPHSADRTVHPDWLEMAAQRFVDNFHLFAQGKPLEYVVDKRAGY
jgi:phosphoglycerate dehydrogenase-like enzyme